MTLAQVMEMRRLTPGMSELLHHIGEKIEADVCAPYLRTARLLERRGFLAMIKRSTDGFTSFRLTEAGREALSGRVAAHGARHTTAHFPPADAIFGAKKPTRQNRRLQPKIRCSSLAFGRRFPPNCRLFQPPLGIDMTGLYGPR